MVQRDKSDAEVLLGWLQTASSVGYITGSVSIMGTTGHIEKG